MALELRQVSVAIGAARPVTDVTLAVPRGACVGIVGPNGSGKSSLLNVISGYYRTSQGEVRILGADCTKRSPHKIATLGVGRSFQGIGHQESLTVKEFVAVSHEARASVGIWRSLVYSRASQRQNERGYGEAESLIRRGGIERYRDALMKSCPYGIRKTADVLRAYGDSPRLVLLDEPSSGLGEKDRQHIQDLIKLLYEQLDCTTIIVDHSIGFIQSLCPRLVVLSAGRVIADGDKEEVLDQSEVQKVLLGAEPIPEVEA